MGENSPARHLNLELGTRGIHRDASLSDSELDWVLQLSLEMQKMSVYISTRFKMFTVWLSSINSFLVFNLSPKSQMSTESILNDKFF